MSLLPPAASLGIPYIAQFRSRTLAQRNGAAASDSSARDWVDDNTLLAALGLNLRETYAFLYDHTPSLEAFEAWILAVNGGSIDPARIARLNAALSGDAGEASMAAPADGPAALTAADLAFWEMQGYVILHGAVPPENCRTAARAIYDFLAIDPLQPDTWYGASLGHTIWVPLLHHPALWANRNSPRIHRAFAQLWRRPDLWVNVDQAGFNPPERPGWNFPGPASAKVLARQVRAPRRSIRRVRRPDRHHSIPMESQFQHRGRRRLLKSQVIHIQPRERRRSPPDAARRQAEERDHQHSAARFLERLTFELDAQHDPPQQAQGAQEDHVYLRFTRQI
jgi:hypothetical protein